jgi:hypothetical protein
MTFAIWLQILDRIVGYVTLHHKALPDRLVKKRAKTPGWFGIIPAIPIER